MKIRFTLNEKFDTDLIAKLKQKASGGSINEAAKFYLRFWHEQELRQEVTSTRQNMVTEASNLVKSDSNEEINLSGLNAIFSEIEE